MTTKDYLFYKASINKIPLSGTFELSPVCNFSCKMCYVRKSRAELITEGKREYTCKQWISLAKECKDAGMLYLLLTGGEPFLYPDFRYLYESLHDMGIVLSINTNGTMIDKETIKWLKQHAPARVNITLYGASEETYEKICGNGQGYKKTANAIIMLKNAGIPVVINASMIPENAADMEKIFAFGKEHDVFVRAGTYMFPPVRRASEETDSRFTSQEAGQMNVLKQLCALGMEDFNTYGERLLNSIKVQNVESESIWGHDNGEQMKCRAGKSSFWISWDGKMTACGIMDYPIVQYPFEKPFSACWQKLTTQVRKKTVLTECQGCPKKEVCKPCAAIIYAETGDVNKKAPYLCEMTDVIIRCYEEILNR